MINLKNLLKILQRILLPWPVEFESQSKALFLFLLVDVDGGFLLVDESLNLNGFLEALVGLTFSATEEK